jgi:hypothetical protein
MGQDEESAKKDKGAAAAAAAAAAAGEIMETKLDASLVSLCDIEVFMAFYVVSILFPASQPSLQCCRGMSTLPHCWMGCRAWTTRAWTMAPFTSQQQSSL